MPCSNCKNPSHNIRKCDDPSVIELWKKTIRLRHEVSCTDFFIHMKNTYALNFVISQRLKSIVAKCNIVTTNRTSYEMIASLTIHLYFPQAPDKYHSPRDYVFWRFLYYLREGFSYDRAYENFRRIGEELALNLQRIRQITYLVNIRDDIQPGTPLFVNTIRALNFPNMIRELFGNTITASDILNHVPAIATYMENAGNITFEDVLQIQKLDIKFLKDEAFEPVDTECEICYDNIKTTYLSCKHEFCGECVKKSLEIVKQDCRKKTCCPFCRSCFTDVFSNDGAFIQDMKLLFGDEKEIEIET